MHRLVASEQREHYYAINTETSLTNVAGALAIWGLTLLAVWGQRSSMLVVMIGCGVTAPFNAWVNHALPRVGVRLEIPRMIVNSVVAVATGILTGWPLPCWLWPIFVALGFDRSGGRFAIATVMTMIAATDVAGMISGVPWIYPVSTTVISLHGWRIANVRVRVIRDMLIQGDHQRTQLRRAHDEVNLALDQLRQETAARERAEVELRAAQKLESLGRIAAGIAHEINTPIQYVGDSLRFLDEGFRELLALRPLDLAIRTAGPDTREAAVQAAIAAEHEADIPYLVENIPEALARTRDGVDRVAGIVRSIKQFAHPGAGPGEGPIDLNEAVNVTLLVARNEYKHVADVETQLGAVPRVACNGGEINQVLLNLVVNAAHAISDVVGSSGRRGTITIATTCSDDHVGISIADTGAGIRPEFRERIFDPFFTTKEVGRGTGQGLAISRAIVARHGGRIFFETELGRGTTFRVQLPIARATRPA